jgi:hypothetical protein
MNGSRVAVYCALLGVLGLAACASVAGNDAQSAFGGPNDTTRGDGGDGGGLPGSGTGGADAAATAAEDAGGQDKTQSSVVLVHASKNLPAFRACFSGYTQVLPQPDDKVMPNANVVGVDVGAAVHISAIQGVTSGADSADASVLDGAFDDAGDDAASADAGSATGQMYVIEEKLIRGFYPQGADAQAGPNCGALVDLLLANNYENHGIYALTGAPLSASDVGTQLIVVRGCLPDPKLTTAECGATFDPASGQHNLHYDIVPTVAAPSSAQLITFESMNVSPGIAGATLTFTDAMGTPSPAFSVPDMPLLSSVNTVALPAQDSDYGTASFTITPASGTAVKVTLADVQAASSPRDLPSHFWQQPTAFAFFVLGDPNVPAATSPTQALHVLAVPVLDPATFPADTDQ